MKFEYIFRLGNEVVELYIAGDGDVDIMLNGDYDMGDLTTSQGAVVIRHLRKVFDEFVKDHPGVVLSCVPYAGDGEEAFRRRVFRWAGFIEDSKSGFMYYRS